MTTFYLAFQNTSAPLNTPYTWNSFQTPATSLATSLLDSTGATVARTITLSSASININSNGLNVVGTGDASWVNQALITDQTWTFSSARTMTFGGLDNSKRYTMSFFGSQDGTGTNLLNVTINGVAKPLNISMNSSSTIEFIDTAPVSSSIAVTIGPSTGVCRLCAIRIDEHDFNPYIVDSITDPVEAGGTLTYTTSEFASLSEITTNQTGITVSGMTGVDGTATVAGWVDNSVYPDLPVDVTYTFSDGTNSDTIDGTVIKPAAYTRLVVASPLLTAGYLAGDILAQTGRTIVSGDVMFHTTYDDFALSADTGYTVSSEGSIDLWVRVAAGVNAGKMFHYVVNITESGVVIEDTTPTASSFGSVTGADITTLTTLPDVVTISGVTAAVDIPAIPASGTEYRVSTNSGSSYGDWTSATTNVQLGFMLQARKMSSGSYSTPTTARVTVGGVNFDGTITTVSADNEPDVLIFTSFTDAEVLSEHTSATVAVTGMSVGETSTFTVANGTYSKNGGSFISTAGTMQNGDTFALRGTSDQYFGRSKDITLTATNGSVVSTYRITNKLDPLLPTGGGSTVVGQFLTGYTL